MPGLAACRETVAAELRGAVIPPASAHCGSEGRQDACTTTGAAERRLGRLGSPLPQAPESAALGANGKQAGRQTGWTSAAV